MSSGRKVRMTRRSGRAISVVARGRLGGHHAADEHERDHAGSAELRLVLRDLALGDPRADLPDRPAEHRVALAVHSFPLPRFRMAYAILDWRLQSSMKPGLACWEKRPPDSPKPASAASYSAFGDERAAGVALPL